MRRYWTPFALSSDLPEADGPPLRVRLLGQDLVAFRDTDGTVGLLNEYCMHRGVSLALGRVEDGGIRCLYHGWKFGADGTIQETPNHCDPRFRARLKAPAYPVEECAGLLWAYMGPAEKKPPFRSFAFMDAPEANRTIIRITQRANYLQLVEQGSDSSHVGVLHSNDARPGWMASTFSPNPDVLNPAAFAVEDNAPVLEVEETPFGLHYAAFRQANRSGAQLADDQPRHVRIYPYLMPTVRFIPASAVLFTVFEVPVDDTTTTSFLVIHGAAAVDRAYLKKILGLTDERFWSEDNNLFRASWENGMGQDRERMKASWTGLPGVAFEDAIMGIAAGPICDRTAEHLVTADAAIVRVRKLLLDSADRVAAGQDPVGVAYRDCRTLAAFDDVLAPNQRWQDLVPQHLAAPPAPVQA
ncbi:MAG TPA: Rieske 2Fe-2S domain-containing protein [Phenylobacterium sp.]|uniref:Rieske 2Fe-2S domain-containing protein n=1 Tax=Phenylobacterium sp. TaxID=1871053 RepID=UPI002B492382|nr:Rieske 2Fe-2S domain-containing protein [Phenylobacterium sp.]HKR86779.1 Rieske 2Fe-2S domain-containing protein [Phenylobacterium sp.]